MSEHNVTIVENKKIADGSISGRLRVVGTSQRTRGTPCNSRTRPTTLAKKVGYMPGHQGKSTHG